MASRKKVNRCQRPQQTTSHAFAMFDQPRIQEFTEVLKATDRTRDGFIDHAYLGKYLRHYYLTVFFWTPFSATAYVKSVM
uniref:EF-hand domain-containing protein n=1 Tax=Angiostrongylus cantonensis TaxID=6313 RepID=A0A0K0CX12_ANGCA